MDWYDEGDDYYSGKEDDIYGGQFHDEEDDYRDWEYDDACGCDACVEYRKEQEKPMKREWIELDTDPFSDNDYPKSGQRVMMWNANHKQGVIFNFNNITDYTGMGYTHWMPEPEGPVKLLKFYDVCGSLMNNRGKQYKRKDGTQVVSSMSSQIRVEDTQAEDWIEVG